MRRLLNSLTVRIWLPFAVFLALITAFLAYYSSLRQAGLFRSGMENKLEELCSVLALSIEVSLEQQNYQGLSKTIPISKQYSAGTAAILFSVRNP
jgi:hypothetical protein